MPLIILHSDPVRILLLNNGRTVVKSQNLRTWNGNISRYRFLELPEGVCGAHIYEFNNERYDEGTGKGFYVVGNPISTLLSGGTNPGTTNLIEVEQARVATILEALQRADAVAGNNVLQNHP